MVSLATCSRLMQFKAGPNSARFYACDRHRPTLAAEGWHANGLFFTTPNEPVQDEDPEDEIECSFCRSEDGPDD